MAHAGHAKQRKGLEASQRLRQGGDIGRGLSCFRLPVGEGLKAPLCLPPRTEQSAFGSGWRGQQKGQSRLLKTLAHPRAQALKLLAEGPLGIGMFPGGGDTMAPIADPRRPMGGLKSGLDDSLRDSGAAVTHHVRGPPTALEQR
jgi:hypothetical protein